MPMPETLESRAAIADLILRYAYNIRMGRGTDCAALFAEDAVYDIREVDFAGWAEPRIRTSLKGRDDIIAYIARPASGVRVCPVIANMLIDVDGADATSNTVMTAHVFPTGQTMMGEYQDSYRYGERGWLFQSRTYTIFQPPQG